GGEAASSAPRRREHAPGDRRWADRQFGRRVGDLRRAFDRAGWTLAGPSALWRCCRAACGTMHGRL
ncbi:MAG: hypothetical protein AVDCRST_MAG43-1316, partial [uncultured Thermomicrobiales bacterium]